MPHDTSFTGAIPEIYDSRLAPILFEGFAADMAARVARSEPQDVLEIAAGSGVVTRALAPQLRDGARYVVSDLNGDMLARAKKMQPEDARLHWREADALALPFGDHSFDVVFCQFGAMFFPDRVAAYREARRVLRPGGRFILSSWGPIGENDFSDVMARTIVELYPDDPPLFLVRTPFGYSDAARIEADLDEAGFADIRIETVRRESRTERPGDFAFAQCYGSPLRLEIEARGTPPLNAVRDAVEAALAERCGHGPTVGRMTALVAEAVAP